MKLTSLTVKRLKKKDRAYKKADGGGLYILVKANGRKTWRIAYRFNGIPNTHTIGDYPIVGLADARIARDELKQQIHEGVNPTLYKRQKKFERENRLDFEAVFLEWMELKKEEWVAGHFKRVKDRMYKNIIPYFKGMKLADIDPQLAIRVLKTIEQRGRLHVCKRVRQDCSRVFRYAVGIGYTDSNPFAVLPLDIFKAAKTTHFASMDRPKDFAKLMQDIREYQGSIAVVCALRMLPHVFLRPSELAGLTWDEVDFEKRMLKIKAQRMKKRRPHLVPMSDWVYNNLKILYTLSNDNSPYVFYSPIGKGSINPESLRLALRRMGYTKEQITPHGFRHMASTMLHELGVRSDCIELQMAHKDANTVRGTYNHAELIRERAEMMKYWSEILEILEEGCATFDDNGWFVQTEHFPNIPLTR